MKNVVFFWYQSVTWAYLPEIHAKLCIAGPSQEQKKGQV